MMTCWRWLILPKGWTIKNRIAKAAMEENMADAYQARSVHLMRLYQAWADGSAGLIITGNMMVDGLAMTRPCGVVLKKICNGTNSSAGRELASPAMLSSGCRSITPAVRCRPTWGK